MAGQISSHVYIFCSDRARNGKTLLCRLFCGHLQGSGPGQFHVFDTYSPNGGLIHYFPDNTEIIDFSKTTGRIKLFDTIMAEPERNYVVDLQAHHLNDFFETYRNIDFDLEARSAGLGAVVYFVQDRDNKSLQAAYDLQNRLNFAEFILVKNDALEKRARYDQNSDLAMLLSHVRSIRLPELSDDLLEVLELEEFSLFDFMASRGLDLPYDVKLELWNLLDFFYTQRAPDRNGFTHYL